MRVHPKSAKVLIASNNVEDAAQVHRHLEEHFDCIGSSVDGDGAIKDFEHFRPDVLVLAFDTLDAAQRYSLALYRLSDLVKTHPHRTVLLCSKDQLRSAFDLCKSGVYDDYVLHWPLAHDGMRLTMSVWNAARGMTTPATPTGQEMLNHTRQIASMDSLLRQQLAKGEGFAALANDSLRRAEREVGAVLDSFAERALAPSRKGSDPDLKDPRALKLEFDRLKKDAVAKAFKASVAGLAPLTAWPGTIREQLAGHLAEMRGFARQVQEARCVVLVVEDDAFARELIAKALESQRYDLLFAHDAASALSYLRRIVPSLILMDVKLPDMDGVVLTRTLKEARHLADVPVLMLTGSARRETLEGSVNAGAVGFIVKPFTRQALLAKLEEILPLPA
jgi:CheY-like chemotaxis protein